MQVGLVVGTANSSVKHPSLIGRKLLLVQLLAADGTSPDGEPVLAIDGFGAGNGEKVIVTSDGQWIRNLLSSETTPARWGVLGIQDQ